MTPAAILVAGLGGTCGDDRAGWRVVEQIEAQLPRSVRSRVRLEKLASPADLLNVLDPCEQLILIDACQGLGFVGQVRELRWPAHELVPTRHTVGHNLSLTQVLEIASRLGTLPAHCELWCIEGAQFEVEQPLTPTVATAADRLAESIAAALTSAAQ